MKWEWTTPRIHALWSLEGVLATGLILFVGVALATVCTLSTCGFPRDARLNDAPEMVEDGRLIGLKREDLDFQLGPPHEGKTFVGFDQGYYLGADDICIDSRWLVVRFDKSGRVEAASLYND